MNHDYIPILGEYNQAKNEAVLNVISYVDSELIVQVGHTSRSLALKKNSTCFCVIPIENGKDIILKLNNTPTEPSQSYLTDIIPVRLPNSITEKIYTFNCDCHFLPEVGAWETVDVTKNRLAFHVGDQIYFDELFKQLCETLSRPSWSCCTSELMDEEITAMIYETVKVAFLRKKNVLQGCFNIMLGDDHDICDESLREKYDEEVTKRVVSLLTKAYHDIQGALRLTQDDMVGYSHVKVLLINNIRARSDQEYLEHLRNKLPRDSIKDVKPIKKDDVLYIMSPRVPMNNRIGCWTTCLYGKITNDFNYSSLYDSILALPAKQIKIFCGDEHIARSFSIGSDVLATNGPRCELFFIGTMNSVLDSYDSEDYIEGIETHRTSNEKKHSYVVIQDGDAHHELIDSCCGGPCLNRWFAALCYYFRVKL